MTRDERQTISIQRWRDFKGKAVVEGATGYGKSYVALKIIKQLVVKKNDLTVLIVVPTTTLKEQWEDLLRDWEVDMNCFVLVINTAIKTNHVCDLLVIDEIHRTASDTFKTIFDCVKYKWILGLTATLKRVDERHSIIEKYCPICDKISLVEAMANGWVSNYKEYLVLLKPDDIDDYIELNTQFNKYFEFFNYDFGKVMACCGPTGWRYQLRLRDEMCPNGTEQQKSDTLKSIKINSAQFMRLLQKRKQYINYHPKKLEVTQRIIDARPNSKIITFSNNVKMAESIPTGKCYTGKDTKKKGRATIEEIRKGDIRVLNTVSKANEGMSIPDLSVAIMLGIDSSGIKAVQRTGRVIRFADNKTAEVFNLVLEDTVEVNWFTNAHNKDNPYIVIDEEGLEQVLRGEEPKLYKKKLKNFIFRF